MVTKFKYNKRINGLIEISAVNDAQVIYKFLIIHRYKYNR